MPSKDQEILRLQAELARLQAKNLTFEEEKEKMQGIIDGLQNMMAWFRKKLFGSMSEEHLPLDPSVLQPSLFDELLSEEEQSALDAEVRKMEEQNAKLIEPHKREVRQPILKGDLPVEETHIHPEGINLDEYIEIGVETTDRIAIRPAVMYIDRTVRHKYVLKSILQIENPDKQTFHIAPLPQMIIPKGMASESFLADILIDKYVYHLPFYRIIQKYKELGVVLSDSTLGDWFSAVCTKLRPLYDKLREKIMSSDYIQVDESTLPVIDNEKHRAVKGYVWAVRDAVSGDVYFHYDMGSRSGETARKLIGGYRGTIQTDGYEVYEAYENAPGKRMIGCWAHARRKFVEAMDESKKHASEALVYIGKLYGIEKEMREANLDCLVIQKRRQEESYKIIQEFEKWMNSVAGLFTPKSRMGKALVYTYTLLPRLSRYVLDGRYNIDNNGIENAIRPIAVGRKNYLFCGNHDAAVRAAIVYSLLGSCKAHDVDVRTWLEDILKRIPVEKDIDILLPVVFQFVCLGRNLQFKDHPNLRFIF
ncbi:MAG: IS66 family transposase [Bacteroidales bacterium]|nr:IS66 family transposase [Bacteroidales bacterium]